MPDNPLPTDSPQAAPTPTSQPGVFTPPAPPKPKKRGRLGTFIGYLLFARGREDEIVIISHSTLFYWWPVWVTGYVMAALTYFNNTHAVFFPDDSKIVTVEKAEFNLEGMDAKQREAFEKKYPAKNFQAVLVPKDDYDPKTGKLQTLYKWDQLKGDWVYHPPAMHNHRLVGAIFILVLLMVIIITNVPLRGLWSIIVLVVIILGSVIMAQAGLWDYVFRGSGRVLTTHINLGGYILLSTALMILWLINFFFFDRQFYMIFTPGQVRVHLEIGGGETAYDTTGIVFQKQRSDIFRHYILGFGSGDLIIRPQGKEHIELHNVLQVSRRVREIEKRLQERQVVSTAQ